MYDSKIFLLLLSFLTIFLCSYPKSNLLLAQNISVSTTDESLILQGKVPRASSRTILPKNILLKYPTLGKALENFSKGLRKAGYEQQGWYLVNNQGLKVLAVTELEQIREDGYSRTDGKRWKLEYSSPEISSIKEFIQAILTGASPGKYRAFIFVFSDFENTPDQMRGIQSPIQVPIFQPQQTIDSSTLQSNTMQSNTIITNYNYFGNRVREGERMPFFNSLKEIDTTSGNYNCNVYIYEYERSSVDGSVKFIEDSNISASQHLKGGGILESLNIE